MPTFCEDCEYLGNPKEAPYRWYCLKFPKLNGAGWQSKEYTHNPPFMRCEHINGGLCPVYEAKRTNQVNLNLKDE